MVHHSSLHLLRIEAAVLVCVVRGAEHRGVVVERLRVAGVGTDTEVVTVTSDTTEQN